MTEEVAHLEAFQRELAMTINGFSLENESGTPDFILSDFLTAVLVSYNDAVQKRAEWRGEKVELSFIQPIVDKLALPQPIQEDIERSKTHFQKVLDGITDDQISYRQKYFEFLMSNPGFLATFGEDFVIEYGPMTLTQTDKGEYNELNEYRVTFDQQVRFYRREVWEALQSAQKLDLATQIRNLRQDLEMAQSFPSNPEAINRISDELARRYDDLTDLGLRLDANGNLESV